jgi:hypothetical protein
MLGFGALLTRACLGRRDSIRIASLAFPIGSGILTWVLFLAPKVACVGHYGNSSGSSNFWYGTAMIQPAFGQAYRAVLPHALDTRIPGGARCRLS